MWPCRSTVTFTYIPLEDEAYSEIIPLGHLNPPRHTFPSDHVYFVLVNETGVKPTTWWPQQTEQ
nr:hypothetical protein [Candidatus Freyrarchaeum guaymaensis]